jgi:hypothetical protein
MDLNSRLFDSIRIKPSCDEPKATAEAVCENPGCAQPGLYWRFCIDHVRAYNATYNYFDGMNDAAVQAYQKDAIIGHRPTWAMGVNRSGQAKPENEPARDWAYVDPLGILRGEGVGDARRRARQPEPQKPRHSATVRRALDVMGLEEGADTAAIKAQYKVLVKRFHPDANGGDRSFEERLRDIIRAHDVLRAAGLC